MPMAWTTGASGRPRAFLWSNGSMSDIGTLGGDAAEAWDINDAGQIVGDSEAFGLSHAFLWQDGTMTDLGTLGGIRGLSGAYGINEAGQVVGYSYTQSYGMEHAFLWQDGVMTDLERTRSPLGKRHDEGPRKHECLRRQRRGPDCRLGSCTVRSVYRGPVDDAVPSPADFTDSAGTTRGRRHRGDGHQSRGSSGRVRHGHGRVRCGPVPLGKRHDCAAEYPVRLRSRLRHQCRGTGRGQRHPPLRWG